MDHTTVKPEAGKGGSSSEVVPNGGIRDGSQETSKKKAVEGSDIIDGHDKPVNATLGAIFPLALYDERFLKKRINWAAYTHEKHKNQIRTCKGGGDSRPTGPPVVRPHRVYKPPADLILEPADSDERTIAADRKLNQQPISEAHISPEPEDHFPAKNATNIKASTLMKSNPAVKVEKDALHFTSGSSCMPGFLDLKNDLAVWESRVEVLRHNRAALAEKKQALEIRLEDGEFDEENPETLELQEEELVLTYSAALTALEESNKRLKDLQTNLKLGRTSAEKLNAEITAAEVQIFTSQSDLTREESTVEAQKEELNVLQPFT
ncbi:hypothetical protein R1sor_003579 [Riccia sorocarpa]|uniref:Uncharacterized protein n=1 Tax=Riccia sorocarpa TaxID=122646 RepID=A0ABD3H4R7_9MARC